MTCVASESKLAWLRWFAFRLQVVEAKIEL